MDIEHEQMTQRTEFKCIDILSSGRITDVLAIVLGKKAVTTFGRIHNNADDNYYNDDDDKIIGRKI